MDVFRAFQLTKGIIPGFLSQRYYYGLSVFVQRNTSVYGYKQCIYRHRTPNLGAHLPYETSNNSICARSYLISQKENSHAHRVMETSPLYKETLAPVNSLANCEEISDEEFIHLLKKDWSTVIAEDVSAAFRKVSYYASKKEMKIEDPMFDSLVAALIMKCGELSDDDLTGILLSLTLWKSVPTASAHNYSELCKAVDQECVNRRTSWDNNKLLYVLDHWHLLRLIRPSDFCWRSINRLCRKPEKLTPSQLVQCMFYINERRKFPTHMDTSVYDFEYSLERCIDKLSLEEIGILAMGFFKSETPIRSQTLVMEIMRRTIEEARSVSDITLAALLKVIRYSLHPPSADTLITLLDKLLNQIPRLSLPCCLHLALVGTNIHVYHEAVMDKVCEKFIEKSKGARLKEIERLAFVLSLFSYVPKTEPSIYDVLVQELQDPERKEEIEKYPKCLPSALYFLSLLQIYLKEEISKVLDKQFLRDTYGRNYFKLGREILCLDVIAELEIPDYNGNRLAPKLRNKLSWILTDDLGKYPDKLEGKLNAAEQLTRDVLMVCYSILGGPERVYLVHLLPHHEKADIMFGIGRHGTAVPIPDSFKKIDMGPLKHAPNLQDINWYCIVIGSWNSFIRGTDKPLGAVASKLRQLKLLGYTPILVPWYEWKELAVASREDYLDKKIYTAVKQEAHKSAL